MIAGRNGAPQFCLPRRGVRNQESGSSENREIDPRKIQDSHRCSRSQVDLFLYSPPRPSPRRRGGCKRGAFRVGPPCGPTKTGAQIASSASRQGCRYTPVCGTRSRRRDRRELGARFLCPKRNAFTSAASAQEADSAKTSRTPDLRPGGSVPKLSLGSTTAPERGA